MERLKRILGVGYLSSKNKETYRKIARENEISPLRVYQLAHGRRPADADERQARQRLLDEGIVGRI